MPALIHENKFTVSECVGKLRASKNITIEIINDAKIEAQAIIPESDLLNFLYA